MATKSAGKDVPPKMATKPSGKDVPAKMATKSAGKDVPPKMATKPSGKDVSPDPEAPKDKDSPSTDSPAFPMTPADYQPPPQGPGFIANFRVNPCICCELRIGVLVAGIIGIVISFLSIPCVTLLWYYSVHYDRQIPIPEFLFHVGICLLGVALSIVLIIGAVKRHAKLVKIALFGYIVAIVLNIIAMIVMITLDITETGEFSIIAEQFVIGAVVGSLIHAYVLYVIYAYFKQLTRTGQQVAEVGGAPSSGQFPVGPPLPTPQQSDSTTGPGSPNVGDSQSTVG